jgi:hypothetical protein
MRAWGWPHPVLGSGTGSPVLNPLGWRLQVEGWLDANFCVTPYSGCFPGALQPLAAPLAQPTSLSACLPDNTSTSFCGSAG